MNLSIKIKQEYEKICLRSHLCPLTINSFLGAWFMLKSMIFIFPLVLLGCAGSKERPTQENRGHITHQNHDHVHAKDCGHETVEHHNHLDYLHDGHYHFMHDHHVDDHGFHSSGRSTASTSKLEVKHEGHSHLHGKNCGHKKVSHGDHSDYLHDGHYHHAHHGQAHDHGIILGQ